MLLVRCGPVTIKDIDIPSADEIIDEAKDEIKEEVPFAELDPSQKAQLLSDHNECKKYADTCQLVEV